MSNHPLWWNGPQWLQYKARWHPDIVPNAYQETLVEAKATRHVFAVAIAETDELDTLFEKFESEENLLVDNAIYPQRSFSENEKTDRATDN